MSAATLTPPPQPARAANTGWQPYRWTIDGYRKLYATGLFCDMKTMLIDGEVFTMVMPNPPHDLSLGLIDDWLRSVFNVGHHVRNQMGFDIGTRNDPGPDLAVVVGNRRDLAGTTPSTAVLVVEVSDTTL